MLPSNIYQEASDMEARALSRPSWAKPYDATAATKPARGPRRMLGHALIGLGRLIAAESAPAAAHVRVGR